jgi:hypothetical protein
MGVRGAVIAAWRSSSWLLGSARWDAAPSRSGAGARTASGKRPSATNGNLPPPIKGAAAADRGADNPVRLLPLFLAAQQSRSLSRFGGSATRRLFGRRCACAPGEALTVPSLTTTKVRGSVEPGHKPPGRACPVGRVFGEALDQTRARRGKRSPRRALGDGEGNGAENCCVAGIDGRA